MSQSYLSDIFVNSRNELCKVYDCDKNHVYCTNLKTGTKSKIQRRYYEIMTTFGGWRLVDPELAGLLYD